MLHLLLKTSIFISLPNECLCQLTGEALIYIPPRDGGLLTPYPTQRPPKRGLDSGVTLPRKRQKLISINPSGGSRHMKAPVRQVASQPIRR